MPLLTTLPVLEQRSRSVSRSRQQEEKDSYPYPETLEEGFAEGEDEGEMSDGSILHRPRPKKSNRALNITRKNEMRTSQILENLTKELKSLEQDALRSVIGDDRDSNENRVRRTSPNRLESAGDPLQSYMSSEEDPSESADDFDEPYVEIDGEGRSMSLPSMTSSHRSRHSREESARAVSFIFVGKPQLVDISPNPTTSIGEGGYFESTSTPPTRNRPSGLRVDPNAVATALQPAYESRPSTSSSKSFSVSSSIPISTFSMKQKRNAIAAINSLTSYSKARMQHFSKSAGVSEQSSNETNFSPNTEYTTSPSSATGDHQEEAPKRGSHYRTSSMTISDKIMLFAADSPTSYTTSYIPSSAIIFTPESNSAPPTDLNTPKTPTSSFSKMVLRSNTLLTRTKGISLRRPSMPKLNDLYDSLDAKDARNTAIRGNTGLGFVKEEAGPQGTLNLAAQKKWTGSEKLAKLQEKKEREAAEKLAAKKNTLDRESMLGREGRLEREEREKNTQNTRNGPGLEDDYDPFEQPSEQVPAGQDKRSSILLQRRSTVTIDRRHSMVLGRELQESPLRYEDIMRTVIREPPPTASRSSSKKKGMLGRLMVKV